MQIYLDHASTTPLSSDTKNYLLSILDQFGNPSSLHSVGQKAKQLVSDARKAAAAFIHTKPQNIYFTCGGSASNTLAVRGYYTKQECHILYSPIAHKSILNCVESCRYSAPLKVDKKGFIDIRDLKAQMDAHDRKPFVVIDYANSEIGTVQQVGQIIDFVHFYDGIVYLDCTGSISTIPLDVTSLDADMCGFSAHKLGGLKGCGVLYKKPHIALEPLIYGSQEQGLVGGTENVLGIASLGKALETYDYASVSSQSRDYVCRYVAGHIPDSYLVGSKESRLPHNLYLCFPGIEGEALMMLLDLYGIQVSTGSACNSQSLTAPAVLSAIGMDPGDMHSCIRMTFCGSETKEELDRVCHTLQECVSRLRRRL